MSDQIHRFTLPAVALAAVMLGACSQGEAAPAPEADNRAEAGGSGAAGSEYAEDGDASADDDATSARVQAPFGAVTIDEVSLEGGSHADAGHLHVRYLDADGSTRADYPEAVVMGSWGAMGDWSVRDDFGTYPVIVAQGGGTWQGSTCSWTSVTELAPDGPVELLNFLDYHDNLGAGQDPTQEYTGALDGPSADGTLTVRYSGTLNQVVTYRRKGNAYEVVSGEEPEGC